MYYIILLYRYSDMVLTEWETDDQRHLDKKRKCCMPDQPQKMRKNVYSQDTLCILKGIQIRSTVLKCIQIVDLSEEVLP